MRSFALALLLCLGLAPTFAMAFEAKHTFAIVIGEGASRKVIIGESDLLEYDWVKQTMKVRPAVLGRIPKLSTSGLAFHVEVDRREVYSGRFMTPLSSQAVREPSILVLPPIKGSPELELSIDRSYPVGLPGMVDKDVRFDSKVLATLIALDKVKNIEPPSLSEQLAVILKECQSIKPGITRSDLMKVFTTEGGLSTAARRTFVHRLCPYIKIDVEFRVADKAREDGSDVVTKVSKPYLDWSIMD